MFFLDELQDIKIYRKKFLLPINDNDKKRGSVAMLMTPSYNSSCNVMNHKLFQNKYFNSYYIERAAMYYINGSTKEIIEEDSSIVTESINDILQNDVKESVIYSGYETDVREVMPIINLRSLYDLAGIFDSKVEFPVYVEVFRRPNIPESESNKINVCNRSNYNQNLKSYTGYLEYCQWMFLLSKAKKPIPKVMQYAIALYKSGLYSIHKQNWIFDTRLKTLCDAMAMYESKHGSKRLDKLLKNEPEKLANKTVVYMIKSDIYSISRMFGFVENYDDYEYTGDIINEKGILQVGEECLFILNEDASYNNIVKKLIYNDRIRNIKEMNEIYESVKADNPWIKYTYNKLERYNKLNLFMDLSRYNSSYIKNTTFKNNRGYDVYLELMQRLINDKRLKTAGYEVKTVIIPIIDWKKIDNKDRFWMVRESINPISCFYNTMMKNPVKLKNLFPDTLFLFIGENGYFKIDFSKFDPNKQTNFFLRNIKLLMDPKYTPEDVDDKTVSAKVMTVNIVDKIEKSQGVEINDISKATTKSKEEPSKDKKTVNKKEEPKTLVKKSDNKANKTTTKPKSEKEIKQEKEKKEKDELVEKIAKSAEINNTEDDVIEDLDSDDRLKQILADLSEDPDEKSNITAARASRNIKLQNDLMEKEFKGKPLKELLDTEKDPMEKQLSVTSLKIDSVNDEWKELTYCNSFDDYKPDYDIVNIFNSFSTMTHPLAVRDITVQDNSTSEDVVDLYIVHYEDENGKRFTIKLDIPKFIDNRYMKLRGNRKDISSQLVLMPIIKTDSDTVQIVSNYKKIFIRRFGTTTGKSNNSCDRLIKTILKNEFKSLKYEEGDFSRICSRYELPIDYVDMAGVFKKLTTSTYDIYFNQDELRDKFKDKIDESKGIPIGYDKQSKNVLYYNSLSQDGEPITFAYFLALLLGTEKNLGKEEFWKKYESAPLSVRYTYSKASIMNTEIPLIVVCGYSEGLTKTLKKGNINFRFSDNKRGLNKDTEDAIKFKDGFLIYKLDYASSLLMNGLKACNTEDYSLSEMNSKGMYLDFLDQFGGRINADGLDNFYNLMIDKPITYDTLKYYKLPTDYIDVLLYANRLLADNKFIKHTNITDNRRIRRNEQIPAVLYMVMATAYGRYCNNIKHGRNVPMTIKQSAVIDEVLANSTTTDKSIINPLNEYEAYTSVTPKGPTGMNSDRSYTLDKRSFDESMFNVLGMSTGFAGTVGVARQATIDSSISTSRGYIVNKNVDNSKLSPTKSLCMTEALTPYGTTRDDPFRTAMTFIQTSKHYMRCKRANPGLITTGADEALPYMISNIFSKKSNDAGKVIDINENRMIVEYKDGTHDYINLEESVEKNSSSGFYVTLKLDTDLKVGSTFKKGDILAYDKSSFSTDIGATDNVTYNIGTIAKIAILNTDEGYEDSAIISDDLCRDMASEVVLMCPNHPIVLDKNTNVYNLVKKGQKIEEGDTLLTIQRPYDEEDANILLKNLVDDPEEITNLGRVPIKSKVTGVVQDIIIYRTVDVDELSPSLKKIVTEYERDLNKKKKEMKQYGIKDADLVIGSTDKLPPTGKLKNAYDSVVIEIYLKYEDQMKVGDKLIYYSALKGVTKDIFPVGKEPYSEYRPNEKIHSLLSVGSVNGRMVGSVLINGAIYKYLIELSRKCKDILNIKYPDNLFEK